MNRFDATGQNYAEVWAECERLREENRDLRQKLGLATVEILIPQLAADNATIAGATTNSKSSPDEKVKLFRSLFRGRDDVYAIRWEGRNGKTGYSPAYPKTWSNSFQKKPDAPKEYFPLTDQVIHDHLTGKLTAGCVPVFSAMYSKRVRGYEAVGYQIQNINDFGDVDLNSAPERIRRSGQ
jgi:hypothetical protein